MFKVFVSVVFLSLPILFSFSLSPLPLPQGLFELQCKSLSTSLTVVAIMLSSPESRAIKLQVEKVCRIVFLSEEKLGKPGDKRKEMT